MAGAEETLTVEAAREGVVVSVTRARVVDPVCYEVIPCFLIFRLEK